MGFSLSKAITGALAGFGLSGGNPVAALVGGAAGLFGDDDPAKSSVAFSRVPSTDQENIARGKLFGLATEELPDVPTRQIAKTGAKSPTAQKARASLVGELDTDFMDREDVRAIIAETSQRGDLLLNRIARGLQASGNITSTPGRDAVGRAVTDVQKSITASLSSFAESSAGRKIDVARLLEGLEQTDAERTRIESQAGLDADFQQKQQQRIEPFTLQADLLRSILGEQPAVQPLVSGGGAKDPLGGLGDIIGQLLSGVISKKD
jgi:hypothetical protein